MFTIRKLAAFTALLFATVSLAEAQTSFEQQCTTWGLGHIGDMDGNGAIDAADIGGFIDALSGKLTSAFPGTLPKHIAADINRDGRINGSDIGPFIQLLSGGPKVNISRGDMNLDGRVDSADATIMLACPNINLFGMQLYRQIVNHPHCTETVLADADNDGRFTLADYYVASGEACR